MEKPVSVRQTMLTDSDVIVVVVMSIIMSLVPSSRCAVRSKV